MDNTRVKPIPSVAITVRVLRIGAIVSFLSNLISYIYRMSSTALNVYAPSDDYSIFWLVFEAFAQSFFYPLVLWTLGEILQLIDVYVRARLESLTLQKEQLEASRKPL